MLRDVVGAVEVEKSTISNELNREANAIYDVQDALHGRAWDANTVCKCLGMCALGLFEDLGLIRACEYNSRDQARMEYLWDNEDLASL